jgi:hypothetical protein
VVERYVNDFLALTLVINCAAPCGPSAGGTTFAWYGSGRQRIGLRRFGLRHARAQLKGVDSPPEG